MQGQRAVLVTITREEYERRKAKYDRAVKTVCPMCPVACGVEVLIKDEKIHEIIPNYEHPLGLLCPRGEAAIEWQYSPDRFLYPKKKVGEEQQRISWDEALDVAAEELIKIKEKYGAEALAIHMGNPFIDTSIDVLTRVFCQAYGTPNFSTGASYCNSAMVMAGRLTFGHAANPSLLNSKCIVAWGANPVVSAPAQSEPIKEAKKGGAKFVVIDPRVSESIKEIGADLHVKIKPGTDGALALALIKVILDEGLYDSRFVERWTVGFDKLPEAVREYTPEKVEQITWVPASVTRDCARMFATKKPACIIQGISPQHSINAFQANKAMYILMAITGNIDVPGGNTYVIKEGYKFPGVLEVTPPPKRIGLNEHRVFVEMYRQASHNLVVEQMLTGKPYPVKGLIILGCNALLTWPNTNKVRQAWHKLDFIMVIDVMESETTRMAHLALPAATYFEKDEVRNYAFTGLPMLGMSRRAVEPLGAAWSEFRIWTELGKRMGYQRWLRWNTPDEFFREIVEGINVEYKDLEQMPRGAFYGTKQNILKYRAKGFNTPSGKFEIYSDRLAEYGYDPVTSYRDTLESSSSQPALATEYPLILDTGARSRYFTHAQHRNVPSLRAKCPEPFLEINPADAERFSIKDGEEVMVETLRGGIKIRARVTEDIIPGVVSMMHGWQESNANVLTNDLARDPITGFTEFRVNLCRPVKIKPS